MPDGTCDRHIHIIGPHNTYPLATTAPFAPKSASLSAYQKLTVPMGIDRAVIVQPSAYGKDNRCTLDAVAELGPRARGIVVIDLDEITHPEQDH